MKISVDGKEYSIEEARRISNILITEINKSEREKEIGEFIKKALEAKRMFMIDKNHGWDIYYLSKFRVRDSKLICDMKRIFITNGGAGRDSNPCFEISHRFGTPTHLNYDYVTKDLLIEFLRMYNRIDKTINHVYHPILEFTHKINPAIK